MNASIRTSAMRLAALALALALAPSLAMAQSTDAAPAAPAAPAPSNSDATTQAPAPAPVEPAPAASKTAKDLADDRNCMKSTGSRIPARADARGRKCTSANGRAYTREDIDRTGAIGLGEALRRLDPAVH